MKTYRCEGGCGREIPDRDGFVREGMKVHCVPCFEVEVERLMSAPTPPLMRVVPERGFRHLIDEDGREVVWLR